MTTSYDPYHLASPTVYLIKILIFLVLVALVGAILATQIVTFFWANPFINSMIFFALAVGIFLSFRQVIRLFPEVKWVNSLQDGSTTNVRPPILLAPVAGLLRERIGEAVITPSSMRSILDSVGNRLDEAKDTSRYLTGLLVFLGLMGTFYGLLETVTSVAGVINALDVSNGDSASQFASLREGLSAPLAGMGTAFSSSLFGLAGSLVLGFLDLQTSQAQNAFYTDLEDWMTSMTELDHPVSAMQANAGGPGNAGHVRQARQLDAEPEFEPERHPRHGRAGARHRWAGQAYPHRAGRPAQAYRRAGRDQPQAARADRRGADAGRHRAAELAPCREPVPARRIEANYWPGFVDALSSLLLVIIFMLSLFMLTQFFLGQEL